MQESSAHRSRAECLKKTDQGTSEKRRAAGKGAGEKNKKTGYELFLAVSGDSAKRLKELTVQLEDQGMGRLFDIDVLKVDGKKADRQEIGRKPRKCLLCQREAHSCSRSRNHTTESILAKIEELIRQELEGVRDEDMEV